MHPRFAAPLSLFRNTCRLARRPSRLMLGAAAATAVAAAGIAASVSAGPAPAGTASAVNHAGAALAGRSHARADAASRPASSRHAAPHAAPAHHSPAHGRVGLTSGKRSGQHPAKPQHAAKSQRQTPARHPARAQRQTPARHAARHAPARHDYLIYDSVTPSAIPSHHAVATYATGNYAVSPAQVAGRRTVMWIDTTGTDHRASILDVEPGDATPAMAATWARARLTADPHALARIYTMRSEWPATQAAIATLPARMRSHVRWWIADPTGYPHIVPGSDATQWYWGSSYDITTASPRF